MSALSHSPSSLDDLVLRCYQQQLSSCSKSVAILQQALRDVFHAALASPSYLLLGGSCALVSSILRSLLFDIFDVVRTTSNLWAVDLVIACQSAAQHVTPMDDATLHRSWFQPFHLCAIGRCRLFIAVVLFCEAVLGDDKRIEALIEEHVRLSKTFSLVAHNTLSREEAAVLDRIAEERRPMSEPERESTPRASLRWEALVTRLGSSVSHSRATQSTLVTSSSAQVHRYSADDEMVTESLEELFFCLHLSHEASPSTTLDANSLPSKSTSLTTMSSKEFAELMIRHLQVASDYIPSRALQRLNHVEFTIYEDMIPGYRAIVAFLSQWDVIPATGCSGRFLYECRLHESARECLLDLILTMPCVSSRNFTAFRGLLEHCPSSEVSYMLTVQLSNKSTPSSGTSSSGQSVSMFCGGSSLSTVEWIVHQSMYAEEVRRTDDASPNDDELTYWPMLLLSVIAACISCSNEMKKKCSLDLLRRVSRSKLEEKQFRRHALQILAEELLREEQCLDEFSQFELDQHRVLSAAMVDRVTSSIHQRAAGVTAVDNATAPVDHTQEKQRLVDEFIERMLGFDSSVAHLYQEVKTCHATLGDMEGVLTRFLERILAVKQEIGDLQRLSKLKATRLTNSTTAEKIIGEIISHLVIPPDVVHLIACTETSSTGATGASSTTDDGGRQKGAELGPQFHHALRILFGVLRDRRGHAKLSAEDANVKPTISNADDERSLRITLSSSAAFRELLGVAEDLAVIACSRIRATLVDKIDVIRKPRTNIAVQQEHVLGPLRPFVAFMKSVLPLLRAVPVSESSALSNSADSNVASSHYVPRAPPGALFHYRVTKQLFSEVKQHYISSLRETYFVNMNRYLMQLNRLEHRDESTSNSSWGLFSARPTSAQYQTVLPLITELRDRISPSEFGIGRRLKVLQDVLQHPAIPILVQAKKQVLPLEEVFRSVNVMLCDVVTREFLFSFDFFGGDGSIYIEVFRPVVQRLVDYVAEAILHVRTSSNAVGGLEGSSSPSRFTNRNPAVTCGNTDVVGILSLIRMCHIFRAHMYGVRRLSCLNGYYDSLLSLLWVAFKHAFELQLAAMKSLTPKQALNFLSFQRSMEEKLNAVHPITLRYAEFSAALMTLCMPIHRVATDGNDEGRSALRGAAISKEDDVDSEDHFAALRTNLSMLKIEFLRVVSSLAAELVIPSSSDSLANTLSSVPVLNNVYHVMMIWSIAPQLEISPSTHSREGSSLGATGKEPFSSDTPQSQVNEQFTSTQPLTASADYASFKELLHSTRGQFVEQLLCHLFPELIAVTRDASSSFGADANPPASDTSLVMTAATSFSQSYKAALVQMNSLIRSVVTHPQNQKEILPMVCMQLLLYNTRLHGLLAKFARTVDPSHMRGVIVSNQELLRFMQSFAPVIADGTSS